MVYGSTMAHVAYRVLAEIMSWTPLMLVLTLGFIIFSCKSKQQVPVVTDEDEMTSISAADLEAFFNAEGIRAIVLFEKSHGRPWLSLRCGDIGSVDFFQNEFDHSEWFCSWADSVLIIAAAGHSTYYSVVDGKLHLDAGHGGGRVECAKMFDVAHSWMKKTYGPSYGYYPFP